MSGWKHDYQKYTAASGGITGNQAVDADIQNPSIEQVTGDPHNTYSIVVAGIDGSGNVLPLIMTATGQKIAQDDAAELNMTEASAAAIKTAVEAAAQFASFQATVATATYQVQLASHACRSVTVKAKSTNTGLIYAGDLNVDSTTGFILSAGDSLSVDISNTNLIWIDSSVSGEGVSVAYV